MFEFIRVSSKRMTNHSYKGLTQLFQTDRTKPRPAKQRVLGAITVATVTAAAAAAVCYPAAARTKTSSISVRLFT